MFLSPVFLAGAAVVSIPFLLHLFWLRRYNKVNWAATEFLRLAYRKVRYKVRLQHLLLLALRCVLLALLVLFFSKPVFRLPSFLSFLVSSPPHVIIALDTSVSMNQNMQNSTSFYQAKQWVKRTLESMPSNQIFSLLTVGDTSEWIETYSNNPEECISKIMELDADSKRADVLEAFLTIKSFTEARSEQFHVYIVSDLQENTWNMELFDSFSLNNVRYEFVDCAPDEFINISINNVKIPGGMVYPQQEALFTLNSSAYGNFSGREIDVIMSVDGVEIKRRKILFRKNRSEAIQFSTKFEEPGHYVVSFQLDTTDSLAEDNLINVELDIGQKSSIICLINRNNDNQDSVKYIEAVFKTNVSPFDCLLVYENSINEDLLSGADVVLVIDLYPLRKRTIEYLEEYADKGGKIVLVPGASTVPGQINDIWYKDGRGLMPSSLGKLSAINEEMVPPYLRISMDNLFDYFYSNKKVILEMPFYKWFEVGEVSGEVLAAFTDNKSSPAIIEKAYGKGKVVLFTSSWARGWSDMVITPSSTHYFMPFIIKLFSYITGIRSLSSTGVSFEESDLAKTGLSDAVDSGSDVLYSSVKENRLSFQSASKYDFWKALVLVFILVCLVELVASSLINRKRAYSG